MISEFVQSIEGADLFPIISLLSFLLCFAGVVTWAVRLDRRTVQHLAELPLEGNAVDTTGGAAHD